MSTLHCGTYSHAQSHTETRQKVAKHAKYADNIAVLSFENCKKNFCGTVGLWDTKYITYIWFVCAYL